MDDMSVTEKAFLARLWWNNTGRQLLVKQFKGNISVENERVSAGGRIKIAGDKTPEIQSGISLGLEWNQLTIPEQMQVIDAWYNKKFLGERQQGLLS